MKKILLFLFIVLSFFQIQSTLANACTKDAKMCSDGTWVGRTGPNCEFVCPGEIKVCTKEYAPVCAQPPMPHCPEGMSCIQVMPQPKTYSNKCMAESENADVIHEGTCESGIANSEVIIEEDALICPMVYAPVCGIDGETYSNSCFASRVGVKHNGICIGKNLESRFESSWDRVFVNGFFKYSIHDKTFVLEKLLEKIDLLETNSEKEYGMYQYIKYMAEKSLKGIYEGYISNNISVISEVDAVLGGTWYVLSFDWLDKNTVIVDYEDGHIMESIKLKIENIKRKISVKILK